MNNDACLICNTNPYDKMHINDKATQICCLELNISHMHKKVKQM